jgi:hypothetical protein
MQDGTPQGGNVSPLPPAARGRWATAFIVEDEIELACLPRLGSARLFRAVGRVF